MKGKIFGAMLALGMQCMAQQSGCDIALSVQVDNKTEMSEQNKNYLSNTINRAISNGGGTGAIFDGRYGVLVKTDVIDENVIEGAPTKYVLNLNMTLYAASIADGKTLSNFSMEVNGVGNTREKAYNNAIRKLSAENKNLAEFCSKAKTNIIEYYDANYKTIIKEAKAKSAVKEYDEALYMLMCIPACCKGYDEALSEAKVAYQNYVNRMCDKNLAEAKSIWAAGYTKENAEAAAALLSEIYPDAACYRDAQALMSEIGKHSGEEWKFKMKQWDDAVSVEKQKISNMMSLAKTFAEHQPQQIIRLW